MVANTRIWIILLITLFGGIVNSYRTYYEPPQTISSINYQIGHRLQGTIHDFNVFPIHKKPLRFCKSLNG